MIEQPTVYIDPTTVYLVGSIYVLVFIAVAAKYPRIALCLSFGMGPIQRAIAGIPFKMSFGDLNMILTFGVFFIQQLLAGKPLRMGPMGWPVTIYMVICVISTVLQGQSDSIALSFAQMVPYLYCAVILYSTYGTLEDFKPAVILLLILGIFLGASVIGFRTGHIYGFNKNGLGSSLAAIVLVAAELWLASDDPRRKRVLAFCMVICTGGLFITLSRGALMGASAGLFLILAVRRDFKLLMRFAAVVIPVLVICWMNMPDESKDFITGFETKRENIKFRLDFITIAWNRFLQSPLIGVGVGFRKDFDATNIILTLLAETGILGLVTFLWVQWTILKMVWEAQRTIPKNSWAYSCLLFGGALAMEKFIHGLVDHYWSRGAILLAWAGVGLVTRVWYASRDPFAVRMMDLPVRRGFDVIREPPVRAISRPTARRPRLTGIQQVPPSNRGST